MSVPDAIVFAVLVLGLAVALPAATWLAGVRAPDAEYQHRPATEERIAARLKAEQGSKHEHGEAA